MSTAIFNQGRNQMDASEILIGVLSGAQYTDRRKLVRKTWGADCRELGVRYHFLCGNRPVSPDDLEDVWLLDCANGYGHLPRRVQLFCQVALHEPDWKWLLKTDDDSYVSIPRLLNFYPPGHYVGARWSPQAAAYASGAGYFLSRQAANVVASFLKAPTGAEDLLVGHLLAELNYPLTEIPDLIVPFADAENRNKTTNQVIISHKMLTESSTADRRNINETLWNACHQETGLHGMEA